ncbi:phosducin-like protein [Limulus polyphemus]|uniref:Phosducin-like protein n=1 Tax=Limulus polyphemus TaxID=6850 RepID=A0ABM1BF44_LIMPO|nr:phosducin-like protein [Limulus polyphemus]
MATLDDKILGEKLHYYCSSDSEEEDETENCDQGKDERDKELEEKRSAISEPTFIPEPELKEWEGSSVNTGPKGVLKDWQRFKQLEVEKREEQERERLDLIKKLSMTCRSHLQEEEAKKKEDDVDRELQELLDDSVLKEYMQKRMEEMMQQVQIWPKHGKLIRLKSGQEFLDAIDKEKLGVTVIIHIYTQESQGCEAMNGCLHCLAQEYPQVKFCALEASSAGMSKHFEESGVPALLVYKSGNLIGNFVRLTDEFGEDFFAVDVESFLVEHGMLPDQSLIPQISKSKHGGRGQDNNESDSDFDVE